MKTEKISRKIGEMDGSVLARFEEGHAGGATLFEMVSFLGRLGIAVSGPTVRKYVQTGLLPRSRRIGAKGKHQGSHGVYPAWCVRRIVEIKRRLGEGSTIEEIAGGSMPIQADCMQAAELLERIEEKVARQRERRAARGGRLAEMQRLVGEARRLVLDAAGQTAGPSGVERFAM